MIAQEDPSRKDRPVGTPLLRPRLGPLAVLYAIGLIIAHVALVPQSDPLLSDTASHVWLATLWAGWSAAVWVLVRPPLTARRIGALGLLLAWHCALLAVARDEPAERYLIMFGGYGVLQATAAMLLGLPRWKLGRGEEGPAEPRPGQFGILNLIVLTATVAVVLLAVRRYGEAGGEEFLPGTAIALALLTLIAATAIAAATMQRWGVAMLPLMILGAASAAAIMASRELAVGGPREFADYWGVYFSILGSFGLLVYAFGRCGRFDAAAVSPPLNPPGIRRG